MSLSPSHRGKAGLEALFFLLGWRQILGSNLGFLAGEGLRMSCMSWKCLCREIWSFLLCRVRFELRAVSMVRLVCGVPFLKWVAA